MTNPLLLSGTAFSRGEAGFSVEPVSWSEEAVYRLPVALWREVMDCYFPNSAWIRLSRDTVDRLQRFKVQRCALTWDEALSELLKQAEEDQQ
jgi:hypothetical protein